MLARPEPSTIMRALFGLGAAGVLAPTLSVAHNGAVATWRTAGPALLIAVAAAVLVHRLHVGKPSWIGGVVVAGSAWLVSQARLGAIDWILAAEVGIGVGLAWPRELKARDTIVLRSGVLAAAVMGVAALRGYGPGAGVVCGIALVVAVLLQRRSAIELGTPAQATVRGHRGRLTLIAAAGSVLVVLAAWIGANSTTADWFGSVVSHGPRSQALVALTFDDGPNIGTTLALSDILDAHGAKGTFFTVGKALDARPDISRALFADGQLLGDHSYHHDEWRWLDPRYPELERTQQAFRRELGVCPALFRPPHGQHTPFMSAVVHGKGMQMVTWDVSAADWATQDAGAIARQVLDKVRGGSIIDLHDGLDGNVTADRSVLIRALPLILDGLQARGLHPVRLDQLLGVAGYVKNC